MKILNRISGQTDSASSTRAAMRHLVPAVENRSL
jgi:hypothetical protein